MYGFVKRLVDWLEAGSRGQWEPEGAPLHPPVAYGAEGGRILVPTHDAPQIGEQPWLGYGRLVEHGDFSEIAEWIPIGGWEAGVRVAPVTFLPSRFPFEYPGKLGELIRQLGQAGVPESTVLAQFKIAALQAPENQGSYLIVGTPMRGVQGESPKQHLAAWYITPDLVKALLATIPADSDSDDVANLRASIESHIREWAQHAAVRWCNVMEDRPEIVTRRDDLAPIAALAGKTVSIWGCGALGAQCAELLVRAGVKRVKLHDNGRVTPGLLVRQPYDHRDIGRPKVEALSDRLRRIRPTVEVESAHGDLISAMDHEELWDGCDLVIDATANRIATLKCEQSIRLAKGERPPIASLMVDDRASIGMIAYSPSRFSGGPHDLFRRAQIELCRRKKARVLDAFWSTKADIFQPEPGCSSPTFRGGAPDVVLLAAAMLNGVAIQYGVSDTVGTVQFVAVGWDPNVGSPLRWSPDLVLEDPESDYEIRICGAAWRDVMGWIRKASRQLGPAHETGGVMFGGFDESVRVLWVDAVSGPPPDSVQSPHEFVCGVEGISEWNSSLYESTRRSTAFVGMWHTHPQNLAVPSHRDLDAMHRILSESDPGPRLAALMIVGGVSPGRKHAGATVYNRKGLRGTDEQRTIVLHGGIGDSVGVPVLGLALSGGGARAMAFHLGCLRALNDLSLLKRVDVLSTVSGGSVIGAMWAYSHEPFDQFDARVTRLLAKGLAWSIARETLLPHHILYSAIASSASLASAFLLSAVRKAATALSATIGSAPRQKAFPKGLPYRRWWTRTKGFEKVLRRLFGSVTMDQVAREELSVVINATELRTQSALRFGSAESGCWRFGKLAATSEVSVAHAVAASAAYPLLLPAMDELYQFDGTGRERMIVTDGGVYENLGVSVFDPTRESATSSNVFNRTWVIVCDAGRGIPDGDEHPVSWPGRMKAAFETAFRRNQTQTQTRLHQLVEEGDLHGLVYAYLGQRDDRLPFRPADLVPRDQVMSYPTDFSSMSEPDMNRLINRGEQLIRILVPHYFSTIGASDRS